MKKTFTLLLAAIMTMLCFAGCGAQKNDSDLAYIQKKGTMVIGMTEYAPMDYKDQNGEWTGFDAEFAKLVGKELGVQVEFMVLADWGKKFFELDSRNIDAVWNGMTITDEALKNTNCTKAYAINAQVVVMKADIVPNYPDRESLKSLNFAVESGSAGEAVLKDLGMSKIVAVQNQPKALMEVAAGTADACVVDITMANAMTGKGTSYENLAVGLTLSSEEYGIGFRKGSDVTDKVNVIIDKFMKDGTLQKLADQFSLTLAGK